MTSKNFHCEQSWSYGNSSDVIECKSFVFAWIVHSMFGKLINQFSLCSWFFFFFGLHGFDFFPPGLLKHSNISEHNSYQVIGRCSWRHFIVGLFIVKNNYEHKDTMSGDLPWIWNQYFVSDSSFCEFCRLWPIYLLLDFKPIWDTVLGDLFHQCLYDWKKRHYFGQDILKLYFWGTRRTLTPTLLYILIVRRLDSVGWWEIWTNVLCFGIAP